MASIQAPYLAGFFEDPKKFVSAAEASTARGHVNHDGYMPYPIHGFEGMFGLKRSWIGRIVLAVLLTGAFAGFMLQFYTMKIDWPLILAGKTYNSWPAFVVITFEVGILSGALTNMACCLLVACRLFPQTKTYVMKPELTDDVFSICIPIEGNGSEEEIRRFLTEQGADDITLYVPEGHEAPSDEKQGEEHA